MEWSLSAGGRSLQWILVHFTERSSAASRRRCTVLEMGEMPGDGQLVPLGKHPPVVGADGPRIVAVRGDGRDDGRVGVGHVVWHRSQLHYLPVTLDLIKRTIGTIIAFSSVVNRNSCNTQWMYS